MNFTSRVGRILLVACVLLSRVDAGFADTSRNYAIEITAATQESPPQITLNWRATPDGLQHVISRKSKGGSTWTQLAILPSQTTTYADSSVVVGQGYEYAITKYPPPQNAVSGYIYAGIKLPLIDSRGTVLLIVEGTYAIELASAISRLEHDLAGDGWTVIRREASRHQTPPEVKSIIQEVYQSDPANVKSVLLLGRVPVPMSGNYEADDHLDHKGAWSADTYYADINGAWTDTTVNNTSATRPQNRNVPGDGKFDQSIIPSAVELEVGRIDFSGLPVFAPRTEKDLLQRYLDKNHDYRHGRIVTPRRAVLYDGFGVSDDEAEAASGWRNFAPFFGRQGTTEIARNDFFVTTPSNAYLWAYLCGGGNYDSLWGVGSSYEWARFDARVVFTMLFGSYFGDWDSTDNFMRSALASNGYVLTAVWAGRPHWFFHHMALGETIGFSTRVTQNNNGIYKPDLFKRLVHISLMGDPTLRMHVVAPPSHLSVDSSSGIVTLNWEHSPDASMLGYHVYRSASRAGPFTRITANPVATNTFSEVVLDGAAYTYMVRAVKLENSHSGSYYNASQGIFTESDETPPVRSSELIVQEKGGRLAAAYLSGNTLVQQIKTGAAKSGWFLKGVADFNDDGHPDYLFNHIDGRISVWFMQDNVRQSAATLKPGGLRKVVGVADFNGDGQPDLLLQNPEGKLTVRFMNGTRIIGSAALKKPAANWRVAGVTDFDNDSHPDLVFQHSDGRLALWRMNGTSRVSALSLPRPKLKWRVIGLKDFNGDAQPDILFKHSDGRLAVWFMNGTSRSGAIRVYSERELPLITAAPIPGK